MLIPYRWLQSGDLEGSVSYVSEDMTGYTVLAYACAALIALSAFAFFVLIAAEMRRAFVFSTAHARAVELEKQSGMLNEQYLAEHLPDFQANEMWTVNKMSHVYRQKHSSAS